MLVLESERLILRTWKTTDAAAYFRFNQDPKVLEYLPRRLTPEQVDAFILGANQQQQSHGFTLWAAELKETQEFIGFIGLNQEDWPAHFMPAVEVGWRLGSEYWGKGYATEGAKAALEYGFNKMGLKEIVSFTVPTNIRSIRVMEKIGMERDLQGDFAHPKLAVDHPLSIQVLYRIKRSGS